MSTFEFTPWDIGSPYTVLGLAAMMRDVTEEMVEAVEELLDHGSSRVPVRNLNKNGLDIVRA